MSNYNLTGLYIYPVKSLGGISLQSAVVTKHGFKYDRRWLLVDEEKRFITQRTHPQMSLIGVDIKGTAMEFYHKLSGSNFTLDIECRSKCIVDVIIWEDNIEAEYVSSAADEWFSDMLKTKCRLVYMPEDTVRSVDKKYALNNEIVSFADGFPFLLIGQASLDDLNSRLQLKLPMNRFRPNIVFTGGNPFDEDMIKSFSAGGITFYPVKPCARCVITTIDQMNGSKNEEPLKTLSTYRKVNNRILFGYNLLHSGTGTISAGDELKIIEWK
ncbi:MAG: MOSC N-terminal beta barrel domain-containing protein [Bacteroidota bacterium]